MDSKNAPVVLDTTVLSNFAHIRRPDLLRVLLGSGAVTTHTVMVELRTGVKLGFVPRCDWLWIATVTLTHGEQLLAGRFRTVLDLGESECLAVAVSRSAVFMTDDLAARRLAQRQGIAVSGTLGALQALVARRFLFMEDADEYLAAMVVHGYRSPVGSLRDL